MISEWAGCWLLVRDAKYSDVISGVSELSG